MENQDFTFQLTASLDAERVFEHLLDPQLWWKGLYGEILEGRSHQPHDTFTFRAGDGAHYSKQILIEVTPNRKIVWKVTESHLSFLDDPKEWDDTFFGFDINQDNEVTHITFTHKGLTPQISCYAGCSSAWMQYMQALQNRFHALSLHTDS
jgi:hypothetical protein